MPAVLSLGIRGFMNAEGERKLLVTTNITVVDQIQRQIVQAGGILSTERHCHLRLQTDYQYRHTKHATE